MNDPFMGQVAVGGSDIGTFAVNFLSSEVAAFLRGGNEFLLKHNMHNVKLLVEGKGTIQASFIDGNGNAQDFDGLTKKELDFKLVEFEQSLVQQYILNYPKDNKATSIIEEYFEEYLGNTPKEDLQEIIAEIDINFGGLFSFMGEDTTQDIIIKYFTKNGKLSFSFANYNDRVRLGQLMVEELYYLRSRDVFAAKLEKIRQNPSEFSEKPSQEKFDKAKKDIPEKDVKIKDR